MPDDIDVENNDIEPGPDEAIANGPEIDLDFFTPSGNYSKSNDILYKEASMGRELLKLIDSVSNILGQICRKTNQLPAADGGGYNLKINTENGIIDKKINLQNRPWKEFEVLKLWMKWKQFDNEGTPQLIPKEFVEDDYFLREACGTDEANKKGAYLTELVGPTFVFAFRQNVFWDDVTIDGKIRLGWLFDPEIILFSALGEILSHGTDEVQNHGFEGTQGKKGNMLKNISNSVENQVRFLFQSKCQELGIMGETMDNFYQGKIDSLKPFLEIVIPSSIDDDS